MKTSKQIKNQIEQLVRDIDSLTEGYSFATNENYQEFKDIAESAVVALDELEELLEGDDELKLLAD